MAFIAQLITAPAQLITAPAQPPATGAAVYTALFLFTDYDTVAIFSYYSYSSNF